jgi:23S rRNA G2445 N2-methylase RlmL
MKMNTFFAKTNPSFTKLLEYELKHIGIKNITNLKSERLNYIKFQTEMPNVWKIMLYSRLTERLKIQVAHDIRVL